jgi:hypothetical protein
MVRYADLVLKAEKFLVGGCQKEKRPVTEGDAYGRSSWQNLAFRNTLY